MTGDSDTGLDIRRFQPGDGQQVRELHDRAMAETPEYLPEFPDEDLEAIGEHYLGDTTSSDFLVGIASGSIVAMGAYTAPDEWKDEYVGIDEHTAELTRMRVGPEWQGRGVGTELYCELRNQAAADGYRRFVLDTGTENERARGFYEGLGFECVREITVDPGDLSLDLALYEKYIESGR